MQQPNTLNEWSYVICTVAQLQVPVITVDTTAGFPSSGTLMLGNEQITYTGIGSTTTFTGITRGANSSTAASSIR